MYVASWCLACFCVVLCVSFCTGNYVMVPLNISTLFTTLFPCTYLQFIFFYLYALRHNRGLVTRRLRIAKAEVLLETNLKPKWFCVHLNHMFCILWIGLVA